MLNFEPTVILVWHILCNRHIDGEYNEFSLHYNPVHTGNIQSRAELLLDQYGRTGSLLPHNVVLVPLGDDFRYDKSIEFDQQYSNYMQIIQFINNGNYDAEVSEILSL